MYWNWGLFFFFLFFLAGIIGDYVILKILLKKTKTGYYWILKNLEKKEIQNQNLFSKSWKTCKNIIFRKFSKRNQNPFKILL
jgi:hypothetical protein